MKYLYHKHPDSETKGISQKGVKRWQETEDGADHLETVSSGCGKAVVPMNTQQLWLPAQIKAVNIPMQVEAELRRTCPWLRSQWQIIALEEKEPALCRV